MVCHSSLIGFYSFTLFLLLPWLKGFILTFKSFCERNVNKRKTDTEKRSMSSITSTDHTGWTWGSKPVWSSTFWQHSSFPSKPLVTACSCGAADELLELGPHFSLQKNPTPHHPLPAAFLKLYFDLQRTLGLRRDEHTLRTFSVHYKYCMFAVGLTWLHRSKRVAEKKGAIKPGEGGQVRHVPFTQLTSYKNLTVKTHGFWNYKAAHL